MSVIDEIKARIDIVDLVSESVQLRRTGKNYTGFCPFHSNTRTPAFVVFPDTGGWRCFGQCNEGGDIFGFVMKKEGWDFSEALHRLSERAGVQLKPPTPQEQAAVEEHDRLRSLLEEAATFYRHQLLNTKPGKTALDYLRGRGLSDETMEAFELGYAPQAWEAATSHFLSKGYTEKDLLEAGLVSEREVKEGSGGIYDRFRNRIIFPIRDERGRMAGFGARVLDPQDVPKFLNSPQTVLFDKGRLLYGLNRARSAIRSQDQAVIVEGYLDVIALHQGNFPNTVSPMGTALSEQQLYLLKRFTRRIVMALDADAAGDKATLRGLQVARQALDHETDPVFDARGLLGFEARLQADIRVSRLPEGLDPDEVVQRDPAEWQRILKDSKPVVIHVMDSLAAGKDLEDPKIKMDIAAQVLPLIEDLPSPVERDTYRQRLARLLRVHEGALLGEMRPRGRRSRRSYSRSSAPPARKETPVAGLAPGFLLETYCLGVLMRRPDLVYRIDRKLQEAGLARLSTEDFLSSDHQNIFQLIQVSLDQDDAEPLSFVLNRLSLPLMDLADELLALTEKLDPNDDRVLEDLLRCLFDMRRRNLRQMIDHFRFLMEDAQQQGDLKVTEYGQAVIQYAKTLDLINSAHGQYTTRAVNQR